MNNNEKEKGIINTIKYSELSSSYRWDTTRNTFPARWWNEILFTFLRNERQLPVGKMKKEIQELYKVHLNKSNKTKSDNNMHINVLLKKLLIKDEQDFVKLRSFTSESLNKIIINHISKITAEMRTKKLPNNWLNQIAEWETTTNRNNHKIKNDEDSREHIRRFVKNNINKTVEVKYNFENSSSEYEPSLDDNQLEEIGKIGEQVVFEILVKKYGIDSVHWTSSVDKYSPYDILVEVSKKEKIYVEVKSTTQRAKINWYISRREIEFYRQHSNNYHLYFVKDVNPEFDGAGHIEKIEKPKIEVSDTHFGINGNKLLVTPIKYKGMA